MVVLTKREPEVSNVIELFSNEIKNQFSTSLCILRTGSALEYVKNNVFTFIPKKRLFIRHLALIDPNKMELLNANINIFWMSQDHDDTYDCSQIFVV